MFSDQALCEKPAFEPKNGPDPDFAVLLVMTAILDVFVSDC
jgi:hypothetical protein